ncbi:MAG: hypothetical protein Q4G30_08910 [Actinomycetaceae bacterium]|nr:hypothetical protein [Actinomycetaceae bacterium]
MPTLLMRHQITETPEVSEAIDIGQRSWPELSRAAVVRRLVTVGAQQLKRDADEERRRRLGILKDMMDLVGPYPENYLEDLRADWQP